MTLPFTPNSRPCNAEDRILQVWLNRITDRNGRILGIGRVWVGTNDVTGVPSKEDSSVEASCPRQGDEWLSAFQPCFLIDAHHLAAPTRSQDLEELPPDLHHAPGILGVRLLGTRGRGGIFSYHNVRAKDFGVYCLASAGLDLLIKAVKA